MTFTDWDGKKYLVKVKSYNIFKTISVADTKYHYLCTESTYFSETSRQIKGYMSGLPFSLPIMLVNSSLYTFSCV